MTTLADVLALASREGRICPRPPAWNRLYELLPGKRRDSYGAIPPAPLTLEAWTEAGDEEKHRRFLEHLQWAELHGALAAIHEFLARLPEDEWHHAGD